MVGHLADDVSSYHGPQMCHDKGVRLALVKIREARRDRKNHALHRLEHQPTPTRLRLEARLDEGESG